MSTSEAGTAAGEAGRANPYLAAAFAWVVPGAGHLFLGLRGRAAAFFSLVLVSLVIGCLLQGNLYHGLQASPLSSLASLACMGMGSPYFVALYLFGYSGDIMSAGYEYGSAFILSAGLMNILLVLDAMDIARGSKE